MRKDEFISLFDKFYVMGIKWEVVLNELLVDDVSYKFLKIPFAQISPDANHYHVSSHKGNGVLHV